MLLGDFELVEELSDGFKASKDSVLPSERMFAEENFESSFVFVLLGIKVTEGAGELVEVIE